MENYKIKLFGGLTEVKHPITGEVCVKTEISISECYHDIPKDELIEALRTFSDSLSNDHK